MALEMTESALSIEQDVASRRTYVTAQTQRRSQKQATHDARMANTASRKSNSIHGPCQLKVATEVTCEEVTAVNNATKKPTATR